ncbi:MAG TPA: hypothetical protein VGS10_22135, partial [Terracidiphilus sp.]|nr:hypothetical protein [Terracidiphilus sp.]
GGLPAPPLKLAVEGDGAMQLAAQRLALNLHDAGFPVQVVSGDPPNADLMLRKLSFEGTDPAAALAILLRGAGQNDPVTAEVPASLYRAEKEILDLHTIVPLLDLPRAWAIGAHLRNFTLNADGTPDLADTSLESAP